MSAPTFFNGFLGMATPGLSVEIANGQSTSGILQTGGQTLVGLFMPAAFTGTAISFLASPDGIATFVPVKDTTSGTLLSYTVGAGAYYALDPTNFYGLNFIQILSNATEGGLRNILAALKGL